MSLTKVTYSMINGAWLNVLDFGADPTGTVDSTAAIQSALDADGDVWFPAGQYIITDSLKLSHSKRIKGEGGPQVNAGGPFVPGSIRTQCAILPRVAGNLSSLGNYPVFVNKTGTSGRQYNIEGFNIFWENVTPGAADSATKGNRYGFRFVPDGVAQYAAPYSTFTDIEINGAWYVYYDNSDNYLNKFKSVIGRFCRFGFFKRLGTLMHFEECSNSIGVQGFHFDNTVSPILINCAADTLTPDASTPGVAANYFVDCNTITIIGWDAEDADINGDSYSYMNFTRVTGSVQGFTGIANVLNCTSGQFVSWFLVTDNSEITIFGFNRKFVETTPFKFDGTAGNVATIRCIGGSRCVLIASDVRAPTDGTPTNRYSLFGTGGFITPIQSIYDSQNVITGVEITGNTINAATINLTTTLTVGTQFQLGDLPVRVNRADDHVGASIFPSIFGDVPITGKLHAVELGTGNYLIADLFKAGTASSVVVTVTANSGLTFSAANNAGAVTLAGFTSSGNVRMKSFIYDISN
jgi:hypothetical protein